MPIWQSSKGLRAPLGARLAAAAGAHRSRGRARHLLGAPRGSLKEDIDQGVGIGSIYMDIDSTWLFLYKGPTIQTTALFVGRLPINFYEGFQRKHPRKCLVEL